MPTYDVNKIIWVDPSKINLVCEPKVRKGRLANCAEIAGGDWDKKVKMFENLDIYLALKNRIEKGVPWTETQFYRRVATEIDQGNHLWKCRNREELDKRCFDIEKLYESIKKTGYKMKQELPNEINDPFWNEDEVIVHIDRNGQLLFGDGRHRLAIAKIVGLNSIPVKVGRRHIDWVKFRSEILQYANEMYRGKVYHPLMHPDFRDIPTSHNFKRFEIIRKNLPPELGEVLDIGAHWGFMSHCFEELGYTCYAVENSPRDVYFLKKLRDAQNKKFEIIAMDILEYHDKKRFKIILALNIFHHFIKEKHQHDRLINFLQRIDTEIIFFQPHKIDEPQMVGSYRNYDCEEFVAFVLKHSRLRNALPIGEADDRRPIYKLYK